MMKTQTKKAIDLREYVPINGIEQFLYHLGTNPENPVLLFLHGGPGSAESLFAHLYEEQWTKLFTLVHWDQRGAGKTLTRNPDKLPTIELMLRDLDEVIQYLKRKYNKQKIVLLGHSWGSVFGSAFVQKHPEDIAYYIGTGQVINMTENEQVGYGRVRELITQAGDKKSLKKLEAVGVYPGEKISFDQAFLKKINQVRKLQAKYRLSDDAFLPILNVVRKSPIFRLSDCSAFLKIYKANQGVYPFLCDFNLWKEPREYGVPVYYILGGDDWQAPYTIAEKYFEEIQAPRKKKYVIPKARHLAMVDQPELFVQALAEIRELEQESGNL